MKKKIVALLIAVLSCFCLSLSAFAATPSFDSSVNGSKALTADECIAWLIAQDSDGSLTEEALNAGYTWAVFEGKNYVTATLNTSESGFGYQFFYDESGVFTVDMYSGSTVSRIAGNTSSGSDNTDTSSGSSATISGIISDVNTASTGFFKIGTSAFDLILSNPVCFLFLGTGFCFTALGLARKAMRASKKS